MIRIASVERQGDENEAKFDELKKSIDELPKKILTWLLIFGSLLVVLQFLGPSIRKAMGMASMQAPSVLARGNSQVSTLPPLDR